MHTAQVIYAIVSRTMRLPTARHRDRQTAEIEREK
jgi:hypothetical protein